MKVKKKIKVYKAAIYLDLEGSFIYFTAQMAFFFKK